LSGWTLQRAALALAAGSLPTHPRRRITRNVRFATTERLPHRRLSVGGWLVVDDYGVIEACRQPVHDYRERHGIEEAISPIDHSGVRWRRAVTGGGRYLNGRRTTESRPPPRSRSFRPGCERRSRYGRSIAGRVSIAPARGRAPGHCSPAPLRGRNSRSTNAKISFDWAAFARASAARQATTRAAVQGGLTSVVADSWPLRWRL
jgi:hypothetical protein